MNLNIKTLVSSLIPDINLFDKNNIYVFELTSQYNKVVVRYNQPEIKLLTVRNQKHY